jgi:enterochelin esterase-like enzyme
MSPRSAEGQEAGKTLTSPRLFALQKEIQGGNRAAAEAFWKEIAEKGSPLVEPVPGDSRNVLITFLWRGDASTRNVVMLGGIAGTDFAGNQMTRLPDTDFWYKTFKTRNDARFTYSISQNDSLEPFEKTDERDPAALMNRIKNFKADPLNPNRFPGLLPSLVELPGAPPQQWINVRQGVPAGKIEEHKFKSAILGNERRLWVYTPPGYNPSARPLALLLMFDGGAYTRLVPTPVILDNLIAEARIQRLVAVMVDSVSRDAELHCNPLFADFLAKELVPWVREKYNVTSDPRHVVVGGSSAGGLAAAYGALQHPEVFGNVLSQSGAFWWTPEGDAESEWLARQYATSKKLQARFFMNVGLFETTHGREGVPTQVVVNRHMRDVLRAKGYDLRYEEFNGGHEYLSWRGLLAEGLIFLLPKED